MRPKRFKREALSLECLPNEIIIEIFSHLNHVDTVCAFSRLNQRFQSLILQYCDKFDFQSITKLKFEYVIRQHDLNRWQSLRLSDDDQTPGQVIHFCQSFLAMKIMPQLKTLSVMNMKPKTHLLFVPKLASFTNLISLTIGFICGKSLLTLQLPLLKHLVINSCLDCQWIQNFELNDVQYTIEHHCTHDCNLIWPNTLKQLKMFMNKPGDNELVRNSLKDLPELTSLAINDSAWNSPPPDGQIWQKLITSSIPNLQKFDFCFKFWKDFNIASDISQVVSTYSTPFYLEEKSWFVKCDSHHQQLSIAMLYSIPFAFDQFDIVTHSFDESVTTAKNSSKINLYEHVQTVSVDVHCNKFNNEILKENIKNLNLKFSDIPNDWIYSMSRLRQLSIGSQISMSSKVFIRLLQNAPCLNTLIASYNTIETLTNKWQSRMTCNLLTQRIHSLNAISSDHLQDYVKIDELVHIVRVFNQRCQHLNITVRSRNLVAGYILRNMIHLRSLNVRLKEHGSDSMITKEWLIKQNSLYENLNYFLVVNKDQYSFWFGCRREKF